MKRLSIFVLVIAIMFAVVVFSASPSWAYPNPFQAIAPVGQSLSTPTITTATDQSPPTAALTDWNYPKCDPHVGEAASPPVSTLSDQWALVIGDCYPNPFNQSSGAGVANHTNTLPAQHAQEVPYVYIGNKVLIIDVATPMINMTGGGADTSAYALHGGPSPTILAEDTGGLIDVPYVYLGKLPADCGNAESSHTMNANLSA